MLVTTSWVDDVKSATGLQAVSQVWAEKPAWYFWISDTPGVHALQLEGITAPESDRPDWVSGLFAVKCYPFPRETVFQSFSFQERSLIQSDWFDHTHTPRFSHREQIPDTLFNVAAVELNVDRDDSLALFTLEGLDLMQISYDNDGIQSYPVLQKEKRFKRGEADRNVPGWDLGYPLFDRLLCLYSFYSKKTPRRLWLTRSPGFSYVFDNDQAVRVQTPEINLFSLSVLFGDKETGDRKEANLIYHQGIENDQEVVYDRSFHYDHFHREPDQPPHLPHINEQWWSLAHSDYKSTLSSTCGCG
ncbi:MAG: hypothetical protein V2I56_12985 [Desulfobacteraceae bacterium]|jgi:hypothetical protein|nr:hypothetical protein [Desulfobacteraceae bacterium]